MHRVRSSHDFDAEFQLQDSGNTVSVKEGKGSFQKYELISRPPRTLLLHLQRKTAGYNLFSKQNTFVEFPSFFDLREFCLFSQSMPSTHISSLSAEEKKEERHLKRVASWKAECRKPVDADQIALLEQYFKPTDSDHEQRSRQNSVDSTYSDVYEIKDENDLSLSDEEGTFCTTDDLSFNPYVRKNALRGGGEPLLYELVAVIHHLGTGLGGHYICYRRIRDTAGDHWYMMNDRMIKEVTWDEVDTKDMYV